MYHWNSFNHGKKWGYFSDDDDSDGDGKYNNNNNNNNNKEGTSMLIDVEISGDRNVIKKGTEKILKYKDLTTEIQLMWNVKTKVYQ